MCNLRRMKSPEKVVIVLCCVPEARKEGRYREPPPTPPGYTALTISDLPDGQTPSPPGPNSTTSATTTPSSRRPPDYTTALQRSRMVTQSPDSQAHQTASKQRGNGLRRGRNDEEDDEAAAEEEDEEEGESPKLVALRKPRAQRTPRPPWP